MLAPTPKGVWQFGDSGVGEKEGLEEGGGRAPPSAHPPWSTAIVSLFPEARVSNNVAADQSWQGSSMPLVCHRRAVDPESARNQTTVLNIVPFRATFDSKVLQSQANRDRQGQTGTGHLQSREMCALCLCPLPQPSSASDTLIHWPTTNHAALSTVICARLHLF